VVPLILCPIKEHATQKLKMVGFTHPPTKLEHIEGILCPVS